MENNLTIETWKMLKSHDYKISNLGNVKRSGSEKNMKFSISNSGYKVYHLYKDAVRTHFYAHKLVAEYFIPNPNNKKVVNHKDGNKMNCHVENLEWTTSSENNTHAYRNNLKLSIKGMNKKDSKLTDDAVRFIRSTIGVISNSNIARKYSVSTAVICNVRKNKAWKHVI